MKRLWDYIEKKDLPDNKKASYFIAANVLLWIMIPLCFCLVIGGLSGYSSRWMQWCFLITGYCSVGIGFFGGILYYMRQ